MKIVREILMIFILLFLLLCLGFYVDAGKKEKIVPDWVYETFIT